MFSCKPAVCISYSQQDSGAEWWLRPDRARWRLACGHCVHCVWQRFFAASKFGANSNFKFLQVCATYIISYHQLSSVIAIAGTHNKPLNQFPSWPLGSTRIHLGHGTQQRPGIQVTMLQESAEGREGDAVHLWLHTGCLVGNMSKSFKIHGCWYLMVFSYVCNSLMG